MFEFMQIGDLYVLYKDGIRLTPIPLTRAELDDMLENMTLDDNEITFINRFYNG